ncbi:hypothetical protein SAMN04488029_3173 [Reichenbachiella faecimaris]|uniref:Uncharacterized protein n=1 Tax=Reichenbachiella faecimaris TaxID=692418 RepID=A0A1W2GK06_REIFA|nr:hypothetical protein [Reichenbachiella faecimaris]SMD36980.1 hypothetical protein SAMN04488029_3173 [Reichenbachiella faecimaris]
MKKNLLIIFLVLLVAFLGTFANIKSNDADKQKIMALENKILVLENYEKAKKEEQKAAKAAAMARIHQRRADELTYELEICE